MLTSSKPISGGQINELRSLGLKALKSLDVPVASLVFYQGKIIGRGYNTVIRNSQAGGHAEINAISDAMRTVHVSAFNNLNKDSLLLISTFEPCQMCRGAILEYGIKHVQFLKPKPILFLAKEELKVWRYLWQRELREPFALQDSLFLLHPDHKQSQTSIR